MPFLAAVPWKLIGIIAAVVLVLGTVKGCQMQEQKIGKLEDQLDSAIEVNNATAKAFEDYRKRAEAAQKIEAEGAKKKAEIRTEADKRRKVIIDALPEDDGPLAPVLRDAINGLRPNPSADKNRRGSPSYNKS